jgi:hypothetical protein
LETKRLYYVAETESTKGFRAAQLGAVLQLNPIGLFLKNLQPWLCRLGRENKTMFAIIVSECRKRTLIIVPSNLLRQQT